MSSNPDSPVISAYMTATPATVNADLTLADALDRMYADNIRHLPVVGDTGKLVGLISTRDIAVAASVRGMDPTKMTVEAAMSAVPYTCAENTPLADVVMAMEKHRLGSAIVTSGDKPVGMFTTTDAMRALRSFIAGGPVEAVVHPSHVVDKKPDDGEAVMHRPRRSVRPSKYDGMVSWFLAPL